MLANMSASPNSASRRRYREKYWRARLMDVGVCARGGLEADFDGAHGVRLVAVFGRIGCPFEMRLMGQFAGSERRTAVPV